MRNLKKNKLKTLLITFSSWNEKRDPHFNDLFFPPLGIPTLVAYLKKLGYSKLETVNFADYGDFKVTSVLEREGRPCSFNSILDVGLGHKTEESLRFYKAAESLSNRHQPDLIGFSVSFYEQLFYALQVAKIIKSIRPEAFIVFGGPIVSANIEHLTKRGGLSALVDGLIAGDGEEPLAELIYNLEKKKHLKNVPNLYYKDGNRNFKKSGGHFEFDQSHIVIPDFDGLDIKRIPLRVSVGCPWGKCSFCTYRLLQKKYKMIGIAEIIDIMKKVTEKYNKRIIFYDDSFLPAHLKVISKTIAAEGAKLSWDILHLELNSGFLNENIPRIMKEAGCNSVTFGLESISPRILRLMNKRQQDPKAIVKILKLFKKAGIDVDLFVIFGFPSEIKEEVMATFNFLNDNRNLYNKALIQQFCLEANTKIFNNPSKFSISRIETQDRYLECLGWRFGFKYETTKGMTTEEVSEFMNRIKKYFPYSGRHRI